jgi:hypothetical protein
MSAASFYKVTDTSFCAEALLDGRRITVNLSGSADANAAAHLQLMLARTQLQARRQPTEEVVVDFRRLEFMVSSCFKNLLSWINGVRDAKGEEQYRIRFLSDSKYLWQRRSLRSLQALSNELVSIEFEIHFAE